MLLQPPAFRPWSVSEDEEKKLKVTCKVHVQPFVNYLTTKGTPVSYGITQFYLPSNRGDVLAITPAEAGIIERVNKFLNGCFTTLHQLANGHQRQNKAEQTQFWQFEVIPTRITQFTGKGGVKDRVDPSSRERITCKAKYAIKLVQQCESNQEPQEPSRAHYHNANYHYSTLQCTVYAQLVEILNVAETITHFRQVWCVVTR